CSARLSRTLFLAGGGDGGGNPGNKKLLRSTDGGATLAEVSGYTIREPHALGFGKAAPGQSYPSVAFAGWLNGVCGVWRSDDNCCVMEQHGNFPARLDEQVYFAGRQQG